MHVSVCLSDCLTVCVYVCVCAFVCVHTFGMSVFLFRVCVCVNVCVRACVCVRMHLHTSVCARVFVHRKQRKVMIKKEAYLTASSVNHGVSTQWPRAARRRSHGAMHEMTSLIFS